MHKLLVFFGFLLSVNAAAQDCPPIDKVPDWNCDGSAVVSVIGDSLVFGVGDSVTGGYVKRLQERLNNVSLNNFGQRGMFAADLPKLLTKALTSPFNAIGRSLLVSDVVVLDVGRNDRWFFKTPEATYRNLKRAAALIKSRVKEETGHTPYVVTAVLMLPNRGAQGPWVKELNKLIRIANTRVRQPELRFDLVSKRLLASDQIHPTSKGYKALAAMLYRFLTVTLPASFRSF